MKICSVSGCNVKVYAKRICRKHYQRLYRYGNVNTVLLQSHKGKLCLEVGCARHIVAKGYCSTHYVHYRMRTDLKYKQYKMEYQRIKSKSIRKQLVLLLGNKCKICGFSDIRALQLDHIKGGGAKQLRDNLGNAAKVYMMYFKDLEKAKEELQVLCANCNWIKREMDRECYIGRGRNEDVSNTFVIEK